MNNEEKRFVLPKIYKAKLETTVSKEEREQLRDVFNAVKIVKVIGPCKLSNDGHLIFK